MKKNKNSRLQILNMNVVNLITILVLVIFSIYSNRIFAWYLYVFFVIILVLNLLMAVFKRNSIIRLASNLSFHLGEGHEGSLSDFHLPLLFLSEQGNILWYNKYFSSIFTNRESIKNTIKELYNLRVKNKLVIREINLNSNVEMSDRSFKMFGNIIELNKESKNGFSIMLYFVETTEHELLKKEHADSQLVVGQVVIDSYEELYQSSGEAIMNQISVEMNKIFKKWMGDNGGIISKLVRDRYILLFEAKHLRKLEADKFSVLRMAKDINVGNTIPVTLSIGISLNGDSLANSYKKSSDAIDLALGRGGDQAVVRNGEKDTYYGGSNVEIERRTKVKARVVSNLLKELIDDCSRVIIMGHYNYDMDSLGSALAVYRASVLRKKKARIVLNNSNPSIDVMYEKLIALSEYNDIFINSSHALNLVDEKTLVVVVDTHIKSLTECPKLLDYASKIVVIDHHRRKAEFIENTVLNYQETYASSTSELLTEILMYSSSNLILPKLEAEALYAGILVDTKHFTFKTGIRTFEAASFLKSQGVDTISVREYFQPNFENFKDICNVTRTSQIINKNIAISVCPSSVKNSQFIAAIAADQMLSVSGIEASFVLSKINNSVHISGRSLGDINVQVILERFGGGGHLTAAGAQLDEVSVEYARKMLEKYITEYINK